MPEIRPFRAWRYNSQISKNIGDITSPLFDVVTDKQLAKLYINPYASVHLSVPNSENPGEHAGELLKQWKNDGVIIQDSIPGIYVYYQYFSLPGSVNEITRKGLIANVRLAANGTDSILVHENTIHGQLKVRTDIIEKTELNISPTHGFYSDPDFELEAYLDEAIEYPIYVTEDYQGVRDVLAVIHDYKVIQYILNKIKNQKIILGDGHHRYQASHEYMIQKNKDAESSIDSGGHNYHMMYLTNADSSDIRILATHRLLTNLKDFDENRVIRTLEENFIIKKIDDAFNLEEVIRGKKHAFGLLFKDHAYRVTLKKGAFESSLPPGPDIVNELDVSVAHHFIIDAILEDGDLSYERSFSDCYAKILQGEAQIGVILNEISMEKVKETCVSGFSLPPKSTYFFPKVVSGFLFSSINDDEFRFPFNLSF